MSNCCIIVINYNTGEMLNQVVSQIIDCHLVGQVIVVDNHSSDNSMSFLMPHAKLLTHYRKHNHGFASSCNYAAQFADTEVLLFLNPDCFISNQVLETLILNLEQTANAGIIGCRVNNPDGSEQRASRRRLPTLWRAIKTFSGMEKLARYCHCFAGVNLNHQVVKPQLQQVEAISGALMLIKSQVFHAVKGFDEQFPLHFEDVDLFKRCLKQGSTIWYNPTLSVIHYQGLSSRSNPKVQQLKKIGLQRYFHKHCSYFSYLIIRAVNKLA